MVLSVSTGAGPSLVATFTTDIIGWWLKAHGMASMSFWTSISFTLTRSSFPAPIVISSSAITISHLALVAIVNSYGDAFTFFLFTFPFFRETTFITSLIVSPFSLMLSKYI